MSISNKSIEEVLNKSIYENLIFDCKKYGIYGTFIEHKINTNADDAGIYFCASPNPETIEKIERGELNASDIELDLKRNSSFFYPEVFSIKLTGNYDDIVRENSIIYCINSEFITTCFKEMEYKVPTKLSYDSVDGLNGFNRKRYSNLLNDRERDEYDKAYKKYIKYLDETYNKKSNGIKSIASKLLNKDTQRLTNIHDFKDINDDIKFFTLPEETYQRFKTFIKKYPEVLYYADKNPDTYDNGKYKGEEGRFSPLSEEPEKVSYRKIAIRDVDESIFMDFLCKLKKEELNIVSISEVSNITGSIMCRKIPASQIDNWDKLCKENDVKYALDNGKIMNSSTDGYAIIYSDKDFNMVNSIMDSLHAGKANHTKINPEQRKKVKELESKNKKQVKNLQPNKLSF